MPDKKPVIAIYLEPSGNITIEGALKNKDVCIDVLSKAIGMVLRWNDKPPEEKRIEALGEKLKM